MLINPDNPRQTVFEASPRNGNRRTHIAIKAAIVLAGIAALAGTIRIDSEPVPKTNNNATATVPTPEKKPVSLTANAQAFAEDMATRILDQYTSPKIPVSAISGPVKPPIKNRHINQAGNAVTSVVIETPNSYVGGDSGQYKMVAVVDSKLDPKSVSSFSISKSIVTDGRVVNPPLYEFRATKTPTGSWSLDIDQHVAGDENIPPHIHHDTAKPNVADDMYGPFTPESLDRFESQAVVALLDAQVANPLWYDSLTYNILTA